MADVGGCELPEDRKLKHALHFRRMLGEDLQRMASAEVGGKAYKAPAVPLEPVGAGDRVAVGETLVQWLSQPGHGIDVPRSLFKAAWLDNQRVCTGSAPGCDSCCAATIPEPACEPV